MNTVNETRIATAMNATIDAVVAKTIAVADGSYMYLVKGTESTVHHALLAAPKELAAHVLGARYVTQEDGTVVGITVYDSIEAAQADFEKVTVSDTGEFAAIIDNCIGIVVSAQFGLILKEVTIAKGIALI